MIFVPRQGGSWLEQKTIAIEAWCLYYERTERLDRAITHVSPPDMHMGVIPIGARSLRYHDQIKKCRLIRDTELAAADLLSESDHRVCKEEAQSRHEEWCKANPCGCGTCKGI